MIAARRPKREFIYFIYYVGTHIGILRRVASRRSDNKFELGQALLELYEIETNNFRLGQTSRISDRYIISFSIWKRIISRASIVSNLLAYLFSIV